ncbi:MAG TPA: energy transducer TonB [Candidatus Eremiobacteraceae bacterium]
MRNFFRRAGELVACALYVVSLGGASPVATPSPAVNAQPPPRLALGSVAIGASVLDAVKIFGAPDVIRNIDLGHEWQWVEAGGLDREVLTDDDMTVRQVLVAVPASIEGESPPPVVQPPEFRALAVPVDDAAGAVAAAGGTSIVEPDPTIRAWSFPGGVLVAELESGAVGRLLALDDFMARVLGYLEPPPDMKSSVYRAPLLTRDYYTSYPMAALRAGIEGRAVVRVLIDPTGTPANVRIVVSSGNADIDAAALESARKSAFRPAHCDDTPCQAVYFDLQDYSIVR